MVRSKSELAIAIELQRLGMWDRCQYERRARREGRAGNDYVPISRSSTPPATRSSGSTSGCSASESYREAWEWKLEWYADNGFALGKNLFTTEDDPAGGLDQAALTKIAEEIDALL